MDGDAAYVSLFLVVLALNLLPAFGPPTWTVIVFYVFNSDLPLPVIVMVGAVAAALGRYILAHAFRLLGHKVSQRTKRNLAAAREAFERRKRSGIIAFFIFALSPIPSAQLFAAIGLAQVRILPFTLAFFGGRLISYSFYGATAEALEHSTLGGAFSEALSNPIGIAIQLVLLGGLVALAKVDWQRVFSSPSQARDPE